MKIAIDIDDVVFEFCSRFIEFTKDKGIKEVCYDDLVCYDINKVLEISRERFMELLHEYNESEHFDNVVFVEGAKEGIEFLNDKFDICFITARIKTIHEKTKKSIFDKFNILEDKVFFSGNIFLEGISKCEICKKLGIGVIIEDNGIDSLKYANNGIKVLLLDKPWNQNIEHERIIRCRNWGEVLEKVEELKDE